MTDRPHNIRPASILDRSFGSGALNKSFSGRWPVTQSRSDDNRMTNRAYVGSHRAGTHHADDQTPAQRRSSRVGKHHAKPTDDFSGRYDS